MWRALDLLGRLELGDFLVVARLDRLFGHRGDELLPQELAVEGPVVGEREPLHHLRVLVGPRGLGRRGGEPHVDDEVEHGQSRRSAGTWASWSANSAPARASWPRGDRFAVDGGDHRLGRDLLRLRGRRGGGDEWRRRMMAKAPAIRPGIRRGIGMASWSCPSRSWGFAHPLRPSGRSGAATCRGILPRR